MNTDLCPVIDTDNILNKVLVYSPLLKENLEVKVEKDFIDSINQEDEQVYLNIDIEKKEVVEE
ncbi:hypothetical protein [Macrococcoides bohemicum]|uniref:hypothetical protein n=1 Tax=Macrococcoides bohemicum TaxID=1903056 RepID=UPI00165DF7DA|nr:hypothetical protein [Macrococcus bohemicus]MBC9875563.1 hypothetical protein [Macrococcus bohemicus]